MTYEYQCDNCGAITLATREVESRHILPACVICDGMTRKLFSRPSLITQRVHESDNWRYHGSATDNLERMRVADKRYEAPPPEDDFSWLETYGQPEKKKSKVAA